jgi:uncharacterized protein (TIGR02421 family)
MRDLKQTDKELSRIASTINLTKLLYPINAASEKFKFFEAINNGTKHNPVFIYSAPKADMSVVIKVLKKAYVDDTPLGRFYAILKKDLERLALLICNVGKDEFTQYSTDLYGKPSKDLIKKAYHLLPKGKFKEEEKNVNSFEAVSIFQKELEKFNLSNWKVKQTKKLNSKIAVGRWETILVREDCFFGREEIKKLVIHEIDSHVFRYENGKRQSLRILREAYPKAEATDEGLAIFNEQKISNDKSRFRIVLLRVLAVDFALNHSFYEVFNKMIGFGLLPDDAFDIAMRVKRGLTYTEQLGGFTKDYLYFRNYIEVCEYVKKKKDVLDLYSGKADINGIALLKSLNILNLPKFVNESLI